MLALVAAAVITTGVPASAAVPPPSEPHFQVVAQPGAARPGERVTVTLTPLDSRFAIVDCLVAFPSQDGGRCRRSSGRWFAETTVPWDARPGSITLRWGIASRDAGAQPGADNGIIEYEVLPAMSSSPSPTPSASPTSSASPTPSASASARMVAVTHQRTQRAPAVAVAPDPPAARPGDAAPADAALWGKRLQVVGWSVLGGVLLALPFALGGTRALIRRRWRRWRKAQPNRPEDVESGDQVEVIPIAAKGRAAVVVQDHDRWPVHLIWTLPPIDPHLEEYR